MTCQHHANMYSHSQHIVDTVSCSPSLRRGRQWPSRNFLPELRQFAQEVEKFGNCKLTKWILLVNECLCLMNFSFAIWQYQSNIHSVDYFYGIISEVQGFHGRCFFCPVPSGRPHGHRISAKTCDLLLLYCSLKLNTKDIKGQMSCSMLFDQKSFDCEKLSGISTLNDKIC